MKDKGAAQAPRNPNRRQILSGIGLVGAGVALGACTPAMSATGTKPDIDLDVLNFALNLEYLEAAFYLAAVGRLSELPGGSAQVILPDNFKPNTFSSAAVGAYAAEIAQDELNHVNFLRTALGPKAVDRPVLDIGPAFAAAANATAKLAGLPTPLSPAFNPYTGDLYFLHGAFIFEDVGVTAYKGAAPLITNATYLEAAAGILAVEAYHAGEIRTLLYAQKDADTGYGVNVATLIQAISNLRDAVDGATDDDQGIVAGTGNPGFVTGANIVAADENSIAYSRNTDQVLNIVYLDATAQKVKGGFFPNGLNGNIK